jgi:hypothetical protein
MENKMLSEHKLPPTWVEQPGSDFHVAVYKDDVPESLIFAPMYNTLELIDDCVYTATHVGNKMMADKICKNVFVDYNLESPTNLWPYIRLRWGQDV